MVAMCDGPRQWWRCRVVYCFSCFFAGAHDSRGNEYGSHVGYDFESKLVEERYYKYNWNYLLFLPRTVMFRASEFMFR